MNTLVLHAYAKINLGLDVIGKRPDGYHEVRMIMQTIKICDEVTLTRKKEPGIRLEMNPAILPVNAENLAYRAAALLMEEFQIREGVLITLKKVIPVAAGMAGGSSDAAAVLRGINTLFGLGLSDGELCRRGVRLGADIPYCIIGGTMLAEGIGEALTPLPKMPRTPLVIAKPAAGVSTGEVYRRLDAGKVLMHPDIDAVMEGLRRQSVKIIAENLGNVLEAVTIPAHPEIAEIKDVMIEQGALGALMSGSGPTVFGLYESCEQAKRAKEALAQTQLAKELFVTETYPE